MDEDQTVQEYLEMVRERLVLEHKDEVRKADTRLLNGQMTIAKIIDGLTPEMLSARYSTVEKLLSLVR